MSVGAKEVRNKLSEWRVQRHSLDNGLRRWVRDVTPSGRLTRKAAAVQSRSPHNRARNRLVAAIIAATKSPIIKIIAAAALFLLTVACASLMNEIIHDLWKLSEPHRQELLNRITDFLAQGTSHSAASQ